MTAKTLRSYKGMTLRNIKVYSKDRMQILLSMITPIIVLGLYILFLQNTYVDNVTNGMKELKDLISTDDVHSLVNAWMISGVIGTSVVTVALNSLSVMVSDKQNKIDFDFNASPIKGSAITLAYFSGALANTVLVSSVLLAAGFVFIALNGTFYYTVIDVLLAFGLVVLGSISSVLILMVFASFFKKNSTLSSFGVMISAAIGFVIGAYIPVSQFSDGVQTAVNLVPGSQIAGMIRNVMMNPFLNKMDSDIGGVDKGEFLNATSKLFATKMNLFGNEIDSKFMLIYSIAAIILFLILNLALYKFSSKRKE